MFKSKPVQRTKNRKLLRQKAIEFLDKNYTRVKPGETVPYDFYMLEKRSINGMKKVRCQGNYREKIKGEPTKTLFDATITYHHFNGKPNNHNYKKIIVDDKILQPIWYRKFSAIGKSASDAVLGGTRRRKSTSSQRKTRRR